MPVTDQDLLLIESFLDKTISTTDLKKFNSRMTDSSFNKAFELQKQMLSALKSNHQEELKLEMHKILDETHIDPDLYKGKRSIIGFAAMFVLLAFVIAALVYFMKDTQKSSHQVFAEAYIPFPADNLQRNDVQVDVLLKNASRAYAQKNFETSQKYYTQIIELNPNNNRAKLFLANTYLSLGQATKAIDILSNLNVIADKNFNYHVDWYLLMAYLSNEDIESAKALINAKSLNNKHSYKNEFDQIMEELK